MAGPHLLVTGRKKKREGEQLGRRRGKLGQLHARSREKETGGLLRFGPGKKKKKRAGWAKKERGRGEKGFRVFISKFFSKSFFKFFKLHSNKKPCIRIMMYKHLLFLTLSK
jgi:hypothetical protein